MATLYVPAVASLTGTGGGAQTHAHCDPALLFPAHCTPLCFFPLTASLAPFFRVRTPRSARGEAA